MATNQRSCLFHRESSLSFCLDHGIYCCVHCHSTSNASCVIKTVQDAVEHFRNKAHKYRVMLNRTTQSCVEMKVSLTELLGSIQKDHAEAVDKLHVVCDQLRGAIDRFESDTIIAVNQVSLGRANSLGKHVDSVEILCEFNSTLNRLLDIDGGSFLAQQQDCTLHDNYLSKVRSELEECQDGLSAVSERLDNIESLSFDEFHAPVHIDKSRIEKLIVELSKRCLDLTLEHNARQSGHTSKHMLTGPHSRLGTEPVDPLQPLSRSDNTQTLYAKCSDPSSAQIYSLVSEHTDETAGYVMPRKLRSTVLCEYIEKEGQMCKTCDKPDAEYEQRCSIQSATTNSEVTNEYVTDGTEYVTSSTLVDDNSKTLAEVSEVCSSEVDATITSSEDTELTPLATAHEGCPNDDSFTKFVFTKLGKRTYTGVDAVVCFVPTAALHWLLATKEPNMLIKYDENGIVMDYRESSTWINDMCVRGTRIYATFADCSVRVLDVDTLSMLETFCGIGACHGINSFGTYFVITWPEDYHKGVYLVGIQNGGLSIMRKSVCLFNRPMFVTSSTALDKIVVSDIYDNSVTILSSGLCPIRKLKLKTNMMRPNGLCMVDDSVFVACHKSKTIVEFGINGGNTTTIFSSNDAVGSPRTISFHKESRQIILSSTTNPKSVFLFKCEEREESGLLQQDDGRSEVPDSVSYPSTTQLDKFDLNNSTAIKAVSDNRGSATYRKLFEFPYKGFDPVARYIQSSPAYIFLSTKQPNMIRKLSESGEEFARNVTVARVNDLCIRDVEIYTSDSDGKIRVYSVGSLCPLRAIGCMFQECTGICTIGKGLALLHMSQGCWRLSRISVTGELKVTLSRTFKHPLFVALAPLSHGVCVTDVTENSIFVVDGGLNSYRTLSHQSIRKPHGVCTDGVYVYVACNESRSVLELHSDYRHRRTILTAVDGIGVPRAISFHKKFGHLVVSSSADPKKIIIFSREG